MMQERLLEQPASRAEGWPWSESCSQLLVCCLQSKCLVQTRSSIGKQEKKSNKIMLLGAGSEELLWLHRAELGGKAANERKPSVVEEAGMPSSLVQHAFIFCSDDSRD